MSNQISVIIVNYNSTAKLEKLLKSLRLIKEIISEILIIDNNSKDFDIKKIISTNKTKVYVNKSNLGFAKAVNKGIKLSRSDYILLLNPDCVILDKSPKKLLKEILKNQKIGAIGGIIVDSNNRRIPSATTKPDFCTAIFEFTILKKLFPKNIYSKKFWVKHHKKERLIEVDSLCGAYILFRKNIEKKQLFFDENFFLYLEDIDFGLNIKKLGCKVVLDTQAKIMHEGGGSSNSVYKITLKHWYKSRKYFFSKYLSKIESNTLKILFTIEEKLLYLYHYIKNEPTE